MISTFEIRGYGIVLPQVQNYYPIEIDEDANCIYSWGFKYVSGVFEYFHYSTAQRAELDRNNFIEALENYWNSK